METAGYKYVVYTAPDIVVTNRKAKHEYHILDTLEAGIALKGSEVKSLRNHKCSLEGSYVSIQESEVWLIGTHIDNYKDAGMWGEIDPKRKRKLLLHRREITKFAEKADQRGFTIVPLRVYFNDKGVAKVEIAVVKGKQLHDKRESEKQRQAERDIRREGL